jgi:hypothetical protein
MCNPIFTGIVKWGIRSLLLPVVLQQYSDAQSGLIIG